MNILKEFICTRTTLQRILQAIQWTEKRLYKVKKEMCNNKNTKKDHKNEEIKIIVPNTYLSIIILNTSSLNSPVKGKDQERKPVFFFAFKKVISLSRIDPT